MRAIVVGDAGVELREVPQPVPGPREVLVRIRAAGLNRAELAIAAGHRHGSQGGSGTIMGLEWAGEVAALGSGVQGLREGDRVMGSGGGSYAEYTVGEAENMLPIPDGMSFEEAATLPVALRTMHDALVTNGRLATGEAVLIQGASSGVGLMALQIARHLGAGLVIGTSTDAGRRARLGEFGADLALDTSRDGWVEAALEATGGRGVALLVDQISGRLVNDSMRATAVLGRIVNVGRLGGTHADFDFDLHALRRISYIGVTFRTRSAEEVREINRRMHRDLWPAVTEGKLRLPIDRRFPLEEAAEALAHMRANQHLGKIVLTI
jgi:NADPH2:quinone reductase